MKEDVFSLCIMKSKAVRPFQTRYLSIISPARVGLGISSCPEIWFEYLIS